MDEAPRQSAYLTGLEHAWARLESQLDLSDGFFLAFLYAASPAPVSALGERAGAWLAKRGLHIFFHRPQDPEALVRGTLDLVFGAPAARARCLWVESLRIDPWGAPGPWQEAWRELLLRLNERRDAMRRHLHRGGLLLAAPVHYKGMARDLAADLWSVRSIVLEPPSPRIALDGTARQRAALAQGSAKDGASERRERRQENSDLINLRAVAAQAAEQSAQRAEAEAEFALAETRRRAGRGAQDPRLIAAPLLDATRSFLAAGEVERALQASREAVVLLRDAPRGGAADLGEALALRARVEQAAGFADLARQHIEEALALRGGEQDEEALEWLDLATELALAREDDEAALDLSARAWRLASVLKDREPGRGEGIYRCIAVLLRRGDVLRRVAQADEAQEAYQAALVLTAELMHREKGGGAEARRVLAACLYKLGNLCLLDGDQIGAVSLYQRSLTIKQEIADQFGETPQLLHDVALNLERLGRASEAAERWRSLQDGGDAVPLSLRQTAGRHLTAGSQYSGLIDLGKLLK